MSKRNLFDKVRTECEKAGVGVEFSMSRSHYRITVLHGNRSRFVVTSATPSDHRAQRNIIADVRRTIRQLKQEAA